jgi:hypothetical protein
MTWKTQAKLIFTVFSKPKLNMRHQGRKTVSTTCFTAFLRLSGKTCVGLCAYSSYYDWKQ